MNAKKVLQLNPLIFTKHHRKKTIKIDSNIDTWFQNNQELEKPKIDIEYTVYVVLHYSFT